MTSRPEAPIASPSWGRAARPGPEPANGPQEAARARPRVRWGLRAPAWTDVAGGAAVLAATAALWAAFLVAVW